MNIFKKVTLKSLALNRTRTIVTIIGIILSASMITAVTTFISSLQSYMLNNAIYAEGDWHGAFFDIDEDSVSVIRGNGKINSDALTQNLGYAAIESSNEYKPYLYILGADENFLNRMPVHIISGRFPETPQEIILPEHLAANGNVVRNIGEYISLSIGDRFFDDSKLLQNNPYINSADREDKKEEELKLKQTRTYTVVGFFKRPAFEDYSAPGYTAITIYDREIKNLTHDIYFKMHDPKETFDFITSFTYSGRTNNDVLMFSGVSRYQNFYSVLYSLAVILISLIMFGSISLIYNAFSISVSERTRQFGLLSSIGATRRQSKRMVMYEAAFVSSIGIPLGILSGIFGIGVTLSLVGDKFYAFYGNEGLSLDLKISFVSIAAALIVAVITVLISAWIPSKRAMKVTAIDAIRLSTDINIRPGKVRTSKLTYKLFGLEGMIAKKHFKRNRRRYRATVVSLFMSIVLFISASSFCTYLTDAVSSTFQDSDFEIFYTYSDPDADMNDLKDLYTELSMIDGVTDSTYASLIRFPLLISSGLFTEDYIGYLGLDPNEETLNEITFLVYGIGDEVYASYLERNNTDPAPYMDPENPRGIAQAIVSRFDQEAQRYVNIPVFKDDHVIVRDNKVPEFDVTSKELVTGLNESYKYGVKVMYPMSVYTKIFDITNCVYYFRTNDPDTTYEKIEGYLTANDLPKGDGILVNLYAMNETDRNMVTVIKVFSYGFITLISLIALANVFNTISTNIMLRRREFAMLKSVGMTRKGFSKMMNFECILYGVKSLIYGLPAAIGVTWLIYSSIVRGYDTHFYLPWMAVVIAILSVFAVVFATMIYSMGKIKKENPIDALKNENL